MNRPTATQRWCARVRLGTDPGACWEWMGLKNPKGYGQFYAQRTAKVAAHRYAFEMFVGPIPVGLYIDHLCRNRGCVNPAHMEPVTTRENTLRGEGWAAREAQQTHCKHGHPLSGSNLRRNWRGDRECRACKQTRRAAYYELTGK
jgi:hypothetical protein